MCNVCCGGCQYKRLWRVLQWRFCSCSDGQHGIIECTFYSSVHGCIIASHRNYQKYSELTSYILCAHLHASWPIFFTPYSETLSTTRCFLRPIIHIQFEEGINWSSIFTVVELGLKEPRYCFEKIALYIWHPYCHTVCGLCWSLVRDI